MITLLRRIRDDEEAATAVEYGLILALVVIAMLAALQGVANETTRTWANVSTKYRNSADEARN